METTKIIYGKGEEEYCIDVVKPTMDIYEYKFLEFNPTIPDTDSRLDWEIKQLMKLLNCTKEEAEEKYTLLLTGDGNMSITEYLNKFPAR